MRFRAKKRTVFIGAHLPTVNVRVSVAGLIFVAMPNSGVGVAYLFDAKIGFRQVNT